MAERAGIGAQLGIAAEESFGTYKAPTTFLPFTSESLALEKNFIESAGLRAGRLAQSALLHIPTTRTVGGDINLEFHNQGMGKLVNLLHGETVSPTKIGSSTAYKQTHKIGLTSPYGKSLTIQVGRPDTGGTVRAFSYLGCKVTSATIAVDSGGVMNLSISVDGQDEKTGEALGSATYSTTAVPFDFTQIEAKVGGSKVGNVRQLTYQIDVPQATDRYHLGNSGVKDQPIANAMVSVTANATIEFASLTDHERFKNATIVSLEALTTGATIGEGNKFTANLLAPAVRQVSSSPTVQGPDIITQDVSFKVLDNGTEAPLTVEYISTDSAL